MATTSQLFLVMSAATLLTFAVSHAGRIFPFRDPWLLAVDRYLGFDWIAHVKFINDRPILEAVLRLSYPLIMPQFCLIGTVLTAHRNVVRLHIFIIATAAILLATNALFLFFPAISAFPYIAPDMSSFSNDNPLRYFREFRYPELIEETRMDRLNVRLDRLDGLVTFPSYHASAAVMFAWAFWSSPLARLPALVLNSLILISIPSQGSHYFIDVIAGILIAIAGIASAKYFIRVLSRE